MEHFEYWTSLVYALNSICNFGKTISSDWISYVNWTGECVEQAIVMIKIFNNFFFYCCSTYAKKKISGKSYVFISVVLFLQNIQPIFGWRWSQLLWNVAFPEADIILFFLFAFSTNFFLNLQKKTIILLTIAWTYGTFSL